MRIRIGSSYKVQNKDEKKLCDFVSMLVFSIYLVNASNVLSDLTGIPSSTVSIVGKGIMGLFFLRTLPVIMHRLNKKMLIISFTSVIVTCLEFLFFQDTIEWVGNTLFTYYTMCFSSFMVCAGIRDFSQLKDSLLKNARFIGLLSMIVLVVSVTGMLTTSFASYSMGFGYACVLPFMCLICSFFEKRELYDLFGAIALIFSMLALGSRGPLMGIVLFGAFFCIKFLIQKRKYLSVIIIILTILIVLFFYKDLLILVADIMELMGINSRTIYLMANNLFSDSGRGAIYETLLNEIKINPLFIRGINSEYKILNGFAAHNIVIELLYQFGICVGGFAVIYIFRKVIKTLCVKDVNDKSLILWMFVFASIPQLMVSNSIWLCHDFWIWLALII